MRKQISLGIIYLLMTMSIIAVVSAGDVQLEISTYPYHQVTVNILNPLKEDPLIFSFENDSDASGKATFNFRATVTKIDIAVAVRKDGKIVAVESFEGYTPIGEIDLIVVKETPQPAVTPNTTANQVTNQTSVNSTNSTDPETTANLENNTDTSTNSEVIPENNAEPTAEDYFTGFPIMTVIISALIILGIIAIIVGIILFLLLRKRNKSPKEIKVKKFSELKKELKVRDKTTDEKIIDELENKIKGLLKEIEDVKDKKTRIRQAEEKVKKDMEELEKLRR